MFLKDISEERQQCGNQRINDQIEHHRSVLGGGQRWILSLPGSVSFELRYEQSDENRQGNNDDIF